MRAALVLGALAAAPFGSPAEAAVLEEFSVEDWSGLALSDDRTGRLASCAVFAKYQNGATLFLIRHVDGGWVLSVAYAGWTLTEGHSYPIRHKVDREAYIDDTGVALDADQIGLALAEDDTLLDQVRHGHLLSMLFQGREFAFELSNSGKALQAASHCIERDRGPVEAEVAAASVDEANIAGDAEFAPAAAPETWETLPARELRTFPPWMVTATDDGDLATCTAFGLYGDDQLILSYRPGVWDFGLYSPALALDINRTYYVWYNVDAPTSAVGVVKRPAEAVEPARILFEVSAEDDIIARMEGGRQLNLEVRGVAAEPQSFSYALGQAAAAFAATRECAERRALEAERIGAPRQHPASAAGIGG